jgi:3-hydroxyisobutyrate dehydrogenase-like beta-hydroxyacid dehydrogenase
MSSRPRIGFIGLGLMGKPMARNLLRAGYALTVHNRSRAAVLDLASEGAGEASSPREVAAASEVVILSLPNSPDVESVTLGPDGLREGLKRGALVVDTTSGLPDASKLVASRLEEVGCAYLDAPVSGGDVGARGGTLSIMVGGPADAFERVLPILKVLGKTVVRVGDVGAGNHAKLANQILVGVTLAAMGEALVFAAKAGVRLDALLEVLGGGLARSACLEVKGPKVLRGDFAPGGKAEFQLKDLRNVAACAARLGVPLPVTELVRARYERLCERGRGLEDHSAIARLSEEEGGVEARLRPSP